MTVTNFGAFALATFLGFLGGALATGTHAVSAASPGTVRATRFELISADGKPLAVWGRDPDRNVVLAFTQANGKNLVALGIDSGNLGFLRLAGTDGTDRATFRLGWGERPFLEMGDEKRSGRVLLGFKAGDAPSMEDETWGLALGTPATYHTLAAIGYFKDVEGDLRGTLQVFDNKGAHWIAPLSHNSGESK